MQQLSEVELLRGELQQFRRAVETFRANESEYVRQLALLQQVVAILTYRTANHEVFVTDAELVAVRDYCGCRFNIEPVTVDDPVGPSGPGQRINLCPLTASEREKLRAMLDEGPKLVR